MHSELCPVCKGDGIIPDTKPETLSTDVVGNKDCHGCDGKGWIPVEDSKETPAIIYVYPQPIYVQPTTPYPYPNLPVFYCSTIQDTRTNDGSTPK